MAEITVSIAGVPICILLIHIKCKFCLAEIIISIAECPVLQCRQMVLLTGSLRRRLTANRSLRFCDHLLLLLSKTRQHLPEVLPDDSTAGEHNERVVHTQQIQDDGAGDGEVRAAQEAQEVEDDIRERQELKEKHGGTGERQSHSQLHLVVGLTGLIRLLLEENYCSLPMYHGGVESEHDDTGDQVPKGIG